MLDDFSPWSICPEDPAQRSAWLEDLRSWRRAKRERLNYEGALYSAPSTRWTQSAFVCGLVMLWEQDFYDPATRSFTVDSYLDKAEAAFGGFDLLILWHAYPRIGFDDRNQFDFYREIPGGLDALTAIIKRLHERGVRAILDYNPWDQDTRQEPNASEDTLVEMVRSVGADGIFLDTLANASEPLREALAGNGVETALQSEAVVPLKDIGDHLISWAQWPDDLDRKLVLRNKWFEPRQMQHVVRRWHLDHRDELYTAWLNGTGIVVWENVFGSWYPWDAGDRQLLARMRPVQRVLARHFAEGEWEPFVLTGSKDLDASLWRLDGVDAWTIVNRSDADQALDLAFIGLQTDATVLDALARRRLSNDERLTIPARGIACVLAADGWDGLAAFERSLLAAGVVEPVAQTPSERPNALRTITPVWHKNVPPDTTLVHSGQRKLESAFRLRECGAYTRAPLEDVSYPDFDQDLVEQRIVTIGRIAFDIAPVTNAQFQIFLQSAGYLPADADSFLAHWINGAPPADAAIEPVTYVNLDDARAYADWAERRLPTEWEWQTAIMETSAGYGVRRVWEWTESEQSDGHTRFAILKGGSDFARADSSWYAERGPLDPHRSSKFILFAAGLDRCSTIGFRCVADLPETLYKSTQPTNGRSKEALRRLNPQNTNGGTKS